MFEGATAFNQDLCRWDLSDSVSADDFCKGASCGYDCTSFPTFVSSVTPTVVPTEYVPPTSVPTDAPSAAYLMMYQHSTKIFALAVFALLI